MNKTTLYLPIANLDVESQIQVGKAIIHPQSEIHIIADCFRDREKVLLDVEKDFGGNAFVAIEVESDGGKLIPEDTSKVEEAIRESLSILYLMQKEIAGRHTVKHQIFGLKSDTPSLQNFIVAKNDGRASYKIQNVGNYAKWEFTTASLEKLKLRDDFQFLCRIASSDKRSDMEQRIMTSIGLIHEGTLLLKLQDRFTKLMTGFEVLLLKKGGEEKKGFTLARICTMMTHAFLLPQYKCLCPVFDAKNANEYSDLVEKSGLPGICSAYNEFKKWYATRSEISHESNLKTVNDHISSFEWWTHMHIMKTIELTSKNSFSSLVEFREYIEKEYQAWRSSFETKLP